MLVLVIHTFCLSSFTGEREEVHAPSGQPKGPRCGEELYVQQAHILHFQYRVKVSGEIVTLFR